MGFHVTYFIAIRRAVRSGPRGRTDELEPVWIRMKIRCSGFLASAWRNHSLPFMARGRGQGGAQNYDELRYQVKSTRIICTSVLESKTDFHSGAIEQVQSLDC
jgi:hypothetical protein